MRRSVVFVWLGLGCGRINFDPASTGDAQRDDSGGEVDTASGASACGNNATGFTLGSINGQGGWAAGPTVFDENIVSGGGFKSGTQAWYISNAVMNQNGIDEMPHSPTLPETAGEMGVRSTGGGDSFSLDLWIDALSGTPDGAALSIDLSPTSGPRMAELRIVNDRAVAGGLWLRTNDSKFNLTTIETMLPRQNWIRLQLVMHAIDGPNNDTFEIWRDGVLLMTRSTWENFYSMGLPVNRVAFRLQESPSEIDASFPDASAQGFLIDDVCYRIFNAAAPEITIASYSTSFEP